MQFKAKTWEQLFHNIYKYPSTYSSANTVNSWYVLCTIKSISIASEIKPPRLPSWGPLRPPWVTLLETGVWSPSKGTGAIALSSVTPGFCTNYNKQICLNCNYWEYYNSLKCILSHNLYDVIFGLWGFIQSKGQLHQTANHLGSQNTLGPRVFIPQGYSFLWPPNTNTT